MTDRSETEELAILVQGLSEDFDILCQRRHEVGAEEYGHLTFLGNDVVRMMLEELADTANYCRYQAIKLMILQGRLEQDPRLGSFGNEEGEITMGFEAFKGTKDVGWKKP